MPSKQQSKHGVTDKIAPKTSEGEGAGVASDSSGPKIDPRDPHGQFAFEFDRIDVNQDGWLSPDELHHGLLSAGWEQDAVCGLFDVIDVNKDGKITRDEFLNYRARTQTKAMSLNPKTVFTDLDEDKDGGLNLRELAHLIKDVNERESFLRDEEVGPYIKSQLAEADKDGDKKLSLAEFLPWYDGFVRHVTECRAAAEAAVAHKGSAALQNTSSASAQPAPSLFAGEGLWECKLPQLPQALAAAWAKKKTPFLIDFTDTTRDPASASPLETFLSYGDYELLEMKRMVVEVNMTKERTLEQAMEDARRKLVNALKHGKVLTVLLANSCPPITSKFTAADTLPIAIFDAEQALAVANIVKWSGMWPEKVIRAQDKCEVIRDFKVLVATKFAVGEYADFLKDEVPLHLMQPIHITMP